MVRRLCLIRLHDGLHVLPPEDVHGLKMCKEYQIGGILNATPVGDRLLSGAVKRFALQGTAGFVVPSMYK
jgi:hypothetical protein